MNAETLSLDHQAFLHQQYVSHHHQQSELLPAILLETYPSNFDAIQFHFPTKYHIVFCSYAPSAKFSGFHTFKSNPCSKTKGASKIIEDGVKLLSKAKA